MIPARLLVVLLAAAAPLAAGCRDRAPDPPDIAEVFPSLPLPPGATFVSRSGGPDALLLTLRSTASTATVQTYYQSTLSKNGWRLVSQARGPDGAMVLLAERDGPPLWVRIRATEDSSGTLVDLGGAVVARQDSSKAAKPTS